MTIGERITYLRNKKAWSQAELARRAKIGQSTLHAYESGTRAAKGMSVDVAMRLARELGVTVDYLVGVYEDEDERPPSPTPPTAKRPRPRKAAPVA
jgi:transcriptional regulator with XRE-family HTH domain